MTHIELLMGARQERHDGVVIFINHDDTRGLDTMRHFGRFAVTRNFAAYFGCAFRLLFAQAAELRL